MIALALMLASQADAGALMRTAGARLSVAEAPVEAADARFRVERDGADAEPRAPRAVDATGTSCGTSVRVCTNKPRTWLSAPIGK